jgi:hypothetical protein
VDVENGSCTCGGQLAYKFPCVHMVFIFRQVGIDEFQFACDTWKRETYVASNRKTGQMGNVTMLQDLEKRNTMPPAIGVGHITPRPRETEFFLENHGHIWFLPRKKFRFQEKKISD